MVTYRVVKIIGEISTILSKSMRIQPRTSLDKFAVWVGLASPDLDLFPAEPGCQGPFQRWEYERMVSWFRGYGLMFDDKLNDKVSLQPALQPAVHRKIGKITIN